MPKKVQQVLLLACATHCGFSLRGDINAAWRNISVPSAFFMYALLANSEILMILSIIMMVLRKRTIALVFVAAGIILWVISLIMHIANP